MARQLIPLREDEKALKERKINEGRFAYTAVVGEGGFTLGIAIEEIQGFFPTNYHSVVTYKEAEDWANIINDRRLSREDACLIVASTMRGSVARSRSKGD